MGLLERHWRIIFGIALIPGIWMIYNGSVRGIEIGEFSYGPDGSDYTSSYTELITRILIPGAISVTIAALAEVGRRRSLDRPEHTPTDARAPGVPPPQPQPELQRPPKAKPEPRAPRTEGPLNPGASRRTWLIAGIGAMSVALLASAALLVAAIMVRDGPYPQRALTPSELEQIIPAEHALPGTLRADAPDQAGADTFFFDAEWAQQELSEELSYSENLQEQIRAGDPRPQDADACLEAVHARDDFWHDRADSMAEQGPEGLGTEAERSFAGPEDLRVTARYQSYEAFQGFGDVWEQQSAVCLPVLAEIDGGAAETRIFDEDGVQGHITVFEYPEHSGVSVNLYQVMGSSSVQYWAQSSDPQDEELIVDMVVELIEHSEASIRAMGR